MLTMVTTRVQDRPMVKMAIWPRGRIPGTQDSYNEGGLMGPLVQSPQSADLRPEKRQTEEPAAGQIF